jgi:hypothetical protein
MTRLRTRERMSLCGVASERVAGPGERSSGLGVEQARRGAVEPRNWASFLFDNTLALRVPLRNSGGKTCLDPSATPR